MHLPDGVLSFQQSIIFIIIAQVLILLSIIVLILILVRNKEQIDEKYIKAKVKLFLILITVIYIVQMFNVQIGPTNLHLVGVVMAAILLGNPWSVVLLITFLLGIQTFIFFYGGVTAIGANIINIGIITNFVGYYSFIGLRKLLSNFTSMPKNIVLASFLGAWISLIIGAFAVALELYFSGFSFELVISLLCLYAIVGLLEGTITALIIWIAISKYKMKI